MAPLDGALLCHECHPAQAWPPRPWGKKLQCLGLSPSVWRDQCGALTKYSSYTQREAEKRRQATPHYSLSSGAVQDPPEGCQGCSLPSGLPPQPDRTSKPSPGMPHFEGLLPAVGRPAAAGHGDTSRAPYFSPGGFPNPGIVGPRRSQVSCREVASPGDSKDLRWRIAGRKLSKASPGLSDVGLTGA